MYIESATVLAFFSKPIDHKLTRTMTYVYVIIFILFQTKPNSAVTCGTSITFVTL